MAGFTGKEIERLLDDRQVHSDFIPVATGISRINVKLRSDQESEINGMGPGIGAAEIDELYEKLDALKEGVPFLRSCRRPCTGTSWSAFPDAASAL